MPPLEPSQDELRRLAERVTELATDFVQGLPDRLTISSTSGASTSKAFQLPLPEDGIGDAVLDDLRQVAEHVRAPTGRRFPYVIGSGEPVGAIADF
jgi:hypothetical protein